MNWVYGPVCDLDVEADLLHTRVELADLLAGRADAGLAEQLLEPGAEFGGALGIAVGDRVRRAELVLRLLARHFKISRGRVEIVSGPSAKLKTISVTGLSSEAFKQMLESGD